MPNSGHARHVLYLNDGPTEKPHSFGRDVIRHSIPVQLHFADIRSGETTRDRKRSPIIDDGSSRQPAERMGKYPDEQMATGHSGPKTGGGGCSSLGRRYYGEAGY